MSGYIIELYKNIISDEKYWTEQSISNSELKNKVYITFGEFDKMTISRTETFSRMRDVSKMSREWIGDRQKILLFELADKNQLEYKEEDSVCGFFSNSGGTSSLCTKLLLGITIFQFKDSQEESKNAIKQSLENCRKNILNIVKKENALVECSVLGLLGTYGVAVIWAADQFTDILKLINLIKGSDVLSSEASKQPDYQFISVFTIFAKNKDGYSEEKISNLKGTAILQMTLQTNLNMSILKKIKGRIPDVKNFHTVGEYDLMLETPAKNVYRCFEKDQIFDPASDFYKFHILQTNVRFCESVTESSLQGIREKGIKDNAGDRSTECSEDTNTLLHVSKIKEKYNHLRELFFDKFPKTAGMVDSLDLLYGDYNSQIASVSNKMWAMDYSQQFLAILNLLESSLTEVTAAPGDVTTSNLLRDVQDILNCFEYQTIHISESDNLLLDTPKCHLRYTGQNNLILYAYFGIIKDLIELAYRMQKESRQSKMIPLISVETVPIITSFLFMDNKNPFEDRLIKFNFPMMAMYALPAYVPCLQHEVFHYVAPRDRVVRNWAKGCILTVYAMKNIICELIYSVNHKKNYDIALAFTEGILNCKIYSVVVSRYFDPLVAKVRKSSNIYKRDEINRECKSWMQYEEWLFELLTKYIEDCDKIVLADNILYEVMIELYHDREEIKSMLDQDPPSLQTNKKEINEMLDCFINSLEGLVVNISPENRIEVFQNLLKETGLSADELIGRDDLEQLSDALKEAVCDLPMIELSRMDAVAYLITYVKIQNDLLKQNDSESQIQHYIRIGIALDLFFSWDIRNEEKLDKLASLKSLFVQSYVGLYFSGKKSARAHGINGYVMDIENEAECWFQKIQRWYRTYLKRYRIFSILLQIIADQASIKERLEEEKYSLLGKFEYLKTVEYHNSVRLYGTEILNYVKDNNLPEEEKRAKVLKAKEIFQKEVFAYNIDIILTYQKQIKFKDLSDICESCFTGDAAYKFADEVYNKKIDMFAEAMVSTGGREYNARACVYTVRDINGLFQTILKLSDRLKNLGKRCYGDKGDTLWYRGHEDSSYMLLPSAMRKYAQYAEIEEYLRNYQRGAYDEFKFRMDNASEKIDKASYTECDYLALMQHYGAPTIYLDWTENAISALYFALEAFIDSGKKNEQNDKAAVLYLLHPNLYNEARNQMMGKVSVTSGRNLDRMMEKSRLRSTSSLPNLSVQYHNEDFGMFLLGNLSNEQDLYKTSFEKITSLSLDKDPENILYLPLAIYASRANERVRAQSGMFMAYNIFTKPSENKYFDYMALEKIQDFYLSKFPMAFPFMYSIIIDGGAKKEIAGWLKAIGVTKDMVYPELSNIGERIW